MSSSSSCRFHTEESQQLHQCGNVIGTDSLDQIRRVQALLRNKMHACSALFFTQEVLQVQSLFQQASDPRSCTRLIVSCRRASHWQSALHLLQFALLCSLAPFDTAPSTCWATLCGCLVFSTAGRCLGRLHASIQIRSAALSTCERATWWQHALQQFATLQRLILGSRRVTTQVFRSFPLLARVYLVTGSQDTTPCAGLEHCGLMS